MTRVDRTVHLEGKVPNRFAVDQGVGTAGWPLALREVISRLSSRRKTLADRWLRYTDPHLQTVVGREGRRQGAPAPRRRKTPRRRTVRLHRDAHIDTRLAKTCSVH
jgi:hypothetical protein